MYQTMNICLKRRDARHTWTPASAAAHTPDDSLPASPPFLPPRSTSRATPSWTQCWSSRTSHAPARCGRGAAAGWRGAGGWAAGVTGRRPYACAPSCGKHQHLNEWSAGAKYTSVVAQHSALQLSRTRHKMRHISPRMTILRIRPVSRSPFQLHRQASMFLVTARRSNPPLPRAPDLVVPGT